MSFGEKRRKRKELLDEIIHDLKTLKARGDFENQYALDENIKLFEALKTVRGYFKWLRSEMPKIDGKRLLELSDFHLHNGKWERILQAELLEIEKWTTPDLLKHLRKEMLQQISGFSYQDRHLILVSLGSGPMEIELQLINSLRKVKSEQKIIFIGIDNSQESLSAAKSNLSRLNIEIIQLDDMTPAVLDETKSKFAGHQYGVVLLKGDALALDRYFNKKSIDMIYYSKFKHHLTEEAKAGLDELLPQMTDRVVECDDLNNFFLRIVPLLGTFAWNHPVVFSGGVFSSLRDPTKAYLNTHNVHGWSTKIFVNDYVRVYDSRGLDKELVYFKDTALKKIINAATQAPSGDNCQPWRFVVRGNEIRVFNVPERDTSLYNWGQRAAYVAHGALIENISITASALGYGAKIDIFPESENPDLVAVIHLEKSTPKDEPLYSYIDKRVTNRKPYKKTPLTEEQRVELQRTSSEIDGATFMFTEDLQKITLLAEAGSVNERILLENRRLHEFFFGHINWTEKEELEKRYGLYIKTLELPKPAEIGFKLFSHWAVLRILNKIGASKAVARQNAQIYASSSAIGIITIENDTPLAFIRAGRLLQRVWLKTTKMDLSLQPLAGITFFMQKLLAEGSQAFSTDHIKLIKTRFNIIKETFGINNEVVAIMFRIGHGDEPSAHSLRFPIEEAATLGKTG